MRRCARLLVLLVLSLSLGLHWAVLQTAAWTGMLVSYSRVASFQEAWQMTFDGRHPCQVCKFVEAGRAAEQQQQDLLPLPRLEPVLPVNAVTTVVQPEGPERVVQFAPPPQSPGRADRPPVPPPRAA